MKAFIKAIVPKPLWNRLRMLRMRYTLASYRHRRVRHNYGGYELEVELADPMGAGWYDHDWPELPEIAFLKRRRLRAGARVFDIGAHQCVVALMLAKTVGPDGFVLAVEANPENCAAGERNRQLNQVQNCRVLHAAGAEHSGTLTFNRGSNGHVDDGTGDWGTMEVKAVSIDDLAAENGVPDVLFVDVEGFECAVLQGARQTLAHGPDCFVEAHVGVGLEKFGGSVERLLSLFPAGYQFFVAPPEGAFVSLEEGAAVMRDRFFLIAARQDGPVSLVDRALRHSQKQGG
jgi:FkbM family methyltransferase